MKFRNYCVVIMGNTKDVLVEIEKVSETKVNVLDAQGILIATFTSSVDPSELSDWFKLNKRSFLVFDLNTETSGFHITKKEIHEGLFGFVRNLNDGSLESKTENFLKEVQMSSDSKNQQVTKINSVNVIKEKLTQKDIEEMSVKEKEILQDKIIDNGLENMTEDDKEILSNLWK